MRRRASVELPAGCRAAGRIAGEEGAVGRGAGAGDDAVHRHRAARARPRAAEARRAGEPQPAAIVDVGKSRERRRAGEGDRDAAGDIDEAAQLRVVVGGGGAADGVAGGHRHDAVVAAVDMQDARAAVLDAAEDDDRAIEQRDMEPGARLRLQVLDGPQAAHAVEREAVPRGADDGGGADAFDGAAAGAGEVLEGIGAGIGAGLHRDRHVEDRHVEAADGIDRLLQGEEGAAGAVGQAGVAVRAVGAHVVGAVGRQHLAPRRQRKRGDAGGAVDDDGLFPDRAVGADLEMEIVVAGGAHLRAARGAGLEQHAGGVTGGRLVDLVLMAVAGVVEQAGCRGDSEFRGGIRRGIDPEQRGFGMSGALAGEREIDVGIGALGGDLRRAARGGVGDADLVYGACRLVERHLLVAGVIGKSGAVIEGDGVAVGVEVAAELWRRIFDDVVERTATARKRSPRGARPYIERILIGGPRQPSFHRGIERPRPVLVGGNLSRLAGPCACRACGHDVARAFGGGAWRRTEIFIEHHELHDRVEGTQRLVVRDKLNKVIIV